MYKRIGLIVLITLGCHMSGIKAVGEENKGILSYLYTAASAVGHVVVLPFTGEHPETAQTQSANFAAVTKPAPVEKQLAPKASPSSSRNQLKPITPNSSSAPVATSMNHEQNEPCINCCFLNPETDIETCCDCCCKGHCWEGMACSGLLPCTGIQNKAQTCRVPVGCFPICCLALCNPTN